MGEVDLDLCVLCGRGEVGGGGGGKDYCRCEKKLVMFRIKDCFYSIGIVSPIESNNLRLRLVKRYSLFSQILKVK